MKRLTIIITFYFTAICLFCAEKIPYRISGGFYGGYIVPISKNLELTAKKPALGGELNVEFLPRGKYDWESQWGFPTIGVGLQTIDLGNPKILGQAFAAYPYVLVPVAKSRVFQLNYKAGFGIGAVTKSWNDCDTLSGINAPTANSTMGSHLSFYISTGANMRFEVGRGVSLGLEFGYNHWSNGSILQPNIGYNIIYGKMSVGFQPHADQFVQPEKPKEIRNLPFDLLLDITANGGVRELYYADNKRYAVASARIYTLERISNFYAVGGGFDVFYDGAFVQQGKRGDENYRQNTHYARYFVPNDNLENKFRCGLTIANYFILGRVTGELDWGVYLYDGMRNANPKPHPKYGHNRPMFYTYNINEEDGWNFFRLGLKVRIIQGLTANATVKLHLQKAEMFEFGLGYQIPFVLKKNKGNL